MNKDLTKKYIQKAEDLFGEYYEDEFAQYSEIWSDEDYESAIDELEEMDSRNLDINDPLFIWGILSKERAEYAPYYLADISSDLRDGFYTIIDLDFTNLIDYIKGTEWYQDNYESLRRLKKKQLKKEFLKEFSDYIKTDYYLILYADYYTEYWNKYILSPFWR